MTKPVLDAILEIEDGLKKSYPDYNFRRGNVYIIDPNLDTGKIEKFEAHYKISLRKNRAVQKDALLLRESDGKCIWKW